VDNDNELGALWIKEGQKGKFMSGKLKIDGKDIPIVIFRNTYKEPGDNKPDYKVYKSKPKDDSKPLDKEGIPF
jgi:hypothetical protein